MARSLRLELPGAPVLVELMAQVTQTTTMQGQKAALRYDLVIQDCAGLETKSGGGESISPAGEIRLFWERRAGKKVNIDFTKANIQELSAPTHGKLVPDGTMSPDFGPGYFYTANPGYVGKDKMVYAVQVDGKNVKVEQILNVVPIHNGNSETFCAGRPSYIKRISATDFQSDWRDVWQVQSALSELLSAASRVTYSFENLPATALGQTTGKGASAQITLDQNAAGHDWFVDPTPLDSSDDYLPTSNSAVWQAKAGSAAEGKMDMFSVLLHEYNHALGLEHSAEAGDFMNASLQPGMRKLPSAEQLTLMSQLVAQLKTTGADPSVPAPTPALSQREMEEDQGEREEDIPANPLTPSPLSLLGLLPLGLTRRSDGVSGNQAASGVSPSVSLRTHDYLTAVNPTLVNGKFHLGANGLGGWESFGTVQATGNLAIAASNAANQAEGQTITLMESTTNAGQTRLAQAFTLSARDRYLAFTVTGLDLQKNSTADQSAPQDAFEVALLNANTGLPVMTSAVIQASRSDALLNIQRATSALDATLAERAAEGVTHSDNADGSRTYLVNLSSITTNLAANAEVNLSFDLICFGTTLATQGSKVGIKDVRLLSTPLAVNDTATLAEDQLLTINAQANDLNADVDFGSSAGAAGFVPELVSQAAHGQVTLLEGGTLCYEPAANYFGADSFTYRYTDGTAAGRSETATVNNIVTPVNDAPVATDLKVTTADDNSATIILIAADAHNTLASLVFGIKTQPTHGNLTKNADGSYSYTPAAHYFGSGSFTYRVTDGTVDSEIATITINVAAVDDVPVASDVPVTTTEDNTSTINLIAVSADNTTARTVIFIQNAPQISMLTQNLIGSHSNFSTSTFYSSYSFTFESTVNERSGVAYANPHPLSRQQVPYLGDVQNDLIDQSSIRLVMPLSPVGASQARLPANLCLAEEIDNEPLSLLAHMVAPVSARLLKKPLGSLRHRGSEVGAAMDAMISGV